MNTETPPSGKRKRVPIQQTEVLHWLATNHPALHAVAEIERAWIWLPVDLRGDEPTRTSIKTYGFIFSKHGGHPLPSGKVGTWGHSCMKPAPFYRKGKGSKAAASQPETTDPNLEKEALAFAGLV